MELITKARLKFDVQQKPNDPTNLIKKTSELVDKIDTKPISIEASQQMIYQYSIMTFGDWCATIVYTGASM